MRYTVTEVTDLGTKTKINQDASHVRILNTEHSESAFGIVCDGVGSCEHSEVASGIAADAFDKWFMTAYPPIADIKDEDEFCSALYERWFALFDSVNNYIIDFAEINQLKLGSTLSCILLRNSEYYILHIGDTRIYSMAITNKILTDDHTIVAKELQRGIITPVQAASDPRRHTLTKCVGMKRHIRPEFYTGQISGITTFLICSDGFRDRICDEDIYEEFCAEKETKKEKLDKAARRIIKAARAAGENDNITAAILQVSEE